MCGLGLLTALVLVSTSALPGSNTTYDDEAPIEVQQACIKWGGEYDICPELLQAICWHESRYTEDIKSGTCVGIMQINEPVHVARIDKLGVTDICDIDENIHVGADLLAELFENYPDAGTVLGLYHGEKDAVKKGRTGNYSSYTKAILEKSYELERIHGK